MGKAKKYDDKIADEMVVCDEFALPKKLSKIGEYWKRTGKNIIEGVEIVDMRAVLK